ncbi:MAG: hypothetical protein ABL900_02020 [Burkholderiaceae bacterium]
MHSPQRHPGSIDFEPTDLSEARKVLDLLPDGVVDPTTTAEFWIGRRRKPEPTDRALSGSAIDWLVKLPRIVRPTALSEQYPRIVNSLAHAWSDRQRCDELLASLRADQRNRRKGFAPAIKLEVERLRAFRTTIR